MCIFRMLTTLAAVQAEEIMRSTALNWVAKCQLKATSQRVNTAWALDICLLQSDGLQYDCIIKRFHVQQQACRLC